MQTAVIAGYTGLVGSHLLPLLLADGQYNRVIAVGRRAPQLEHERLHYQAVDFNQLHLDIDKVDVVYCCLGTTIRKAGSREQFRLVDFQYPLNLAEACLELGARQFILVSSMGADKHSVFFYNRVKGEAEEAIISLGYSRTDICRPSILLGTRQEWRPAEQAGKLFMQAFAWLMWGPWRHYRPIRAATVARAMHCYGKQQASGEFVHLSDELKKDSQCES